jgi:hypothetical protein
MATQQNSKLKNNEEQTVRRKTAIAKMELKSEAVFLHMRGQAGEAIHKSLYRMGELFKMTHRSSDKKAYNTIKEWFQTEIIDFTNKDIDKLVNYFETLQSQLVPGYIFLDIKNPNMDLEFSIIHKSHLEIINLISKIDIVMDDIEAIALSGSFDDDIENSARNQALSILNNISSKIFKVTKPGKRNGGPFSPGFFLENLQKGVFTLYPDADTDTKVKSNVVNMDSKNESKLSDKKTKSDVELTEAV